jgi:hypothetical protein
VLHALVGPANVVRTDVTRFDATRPSPLVRAKNVDRSRLVNGTIP